MFRFSTNKTDKQMHTENTHKTVLLKESIEGLAIASGDTFVDGTINGGGHSELVAKMFNSQVYIVGIDLDDGAFVRCRPRLEALGANFVLQQGNFKDMREILGRVHIDKVNRILLDLGWSTNQFEHGERGFSFQKDEPLLMTYSSNALHTAYDIVNRTPEKELADLIYLYGEERYSRRIARTIVEHRARKPIETSKELADIITRALPHRPFFMRIHPATKTFQAIRIAVNDELRTLEAALPEAFDLLQKGGRLAVISFHSLEDRIVKRFMRSMHDAQKGVLVVKKPIIPTPEEEKENPRSRSAKLRIIEKTHE